MPQITTVTSESLQATIRRLLPSQQGFGVDLEATNVITPIIDLTATAEGSLLPRDLSEALSFDSSTAYEVVGATSTIVNTPGFWRVTYQSSVIGNNTTERFNRFQLGQGATNKVVWAHNVEPGGINDEVTVLHGSLVFFLQGGETLQCVCKPDCSLSGSFRQVADLQGNLIDPVGFVNQ